MTDQDGWMDGWEHVNLDTGLSWTGGPGKFVFHTAEGSSMEGLINTFKGNPTIASQLGICWKTKRKVQFISLLHSGKALRNLPGGVETNRDQVYQAEIVGFWTESPDIPEEGLKFIGECLADVWLATGGAFKLEMGDLQLVGPEDGYTARVNSPFRYTPQEWDNFNGIAGHCNVPENEHTDPGKLNMDRIFYYAQLKIYFTLHPPLEESSTSKDTSMYNVTNANGVVMTMRVDDGRLVNSWRVDGKRVPWAEMIPGTVVESLGQPAVNGRVIWVPIVARTVYGDVLLTLVQASPGEAFTVHGTDDLNDFINSLHK